jgi:hypothetical protein
LNITPLSYALKKGTNGGFWPTAEILAGGRGSRLLGSAAADRPCAVVVDPPKIGSAA